MLEMPESTSGIMSDSLCPKKIESDSSAAFWGLLSICQIAYLTGPAAVSLSNPRNDWGFRGDVN